MSKKKKLLQSKFYFNCYDHGIFTKYFLDAEILFVTSFMCLHVQLVKVLWTVIIKNLNLKEKDIKDNSYIAHYFILLISNCYLSINYAYSKFYIHLKYYRPEDYSNDHLSKMTDLLSSR